MKSQIGFLAIFSFSALAQPVYAASRTPTSSCICCYFLYLSVCLHQGAEAQNDAATQRAQVPDTRLHRVSEAEVCLLWPQVTTEREGGVGRGKHILSDKDTDAHPEKWTSPPPPPLLSFHLNLGQPPPLNLNCEILTFFCVTCWTVCGVFFVRVVSKDEAGITLWNTPSSVDQASCETTAGRQSPFSHPSALNSLPRPERHI